MSRGKAGKTVEKAVVYLVFGLAILLAFGIFVKTFVIYHKNQSMFSAEYTKAMSRVLENTALLDLSNNTVALEKQKLEAYVDYLEKLHELHKSSSNIDLFVFLYGFLSSILIGVSTFFAKNSKENSDKAKEAAEDAEKSLVALKSGVQLIESKTNLTKKEVKWSKAVAEQAKAEAEQVKKSIDAVSGELELIETKLQSEQLLLTVSQALTLIQNCELMVLQGGTGRIGALLPRFSERLKDVYKQGGAIDFGKAYPPAKRRIKDNLGEIYTMLSKCHNTRPDIFTDFYFGQMEKLIMDCIGFIEK